MNEDGKIYVIAGTNTKTGFCLRASGDSMINAKILDGDIVLSKKEMAKSRKIAAVPVNNDNETTLKKGLILWKEENPS